MLVAALVLASVRAEAQEAVNIADITSGFPAATLRLPVSELSASDMENLQALQQQAEGATPGTMICNTGQTPYGQGAGGGIGVPAHQDRPGL